MTDFRFVVPDVTYTSQPKLLQVRNYFTEGQWKTVETVVLPLAEYESIKAELATKEKRKFQLDRINAYVEGTVQAVSSSEKGKQESSIEQELAQLTLQNLKSVQALTEGYGVVGIVGSSAWLGQMKTLLEVAQSALDKIFRVTNEDRPEDGCDPVFMEALRRGEHLKFIQERCNEQKGQAVSHSEDWIEWKGFASPPDLKDGGGGATYISSAPAEITLEVKTRSIKDRPFRTYVTQAGETLGDIAQTQLCYRGKWIYIWNLNKDSFYDVLEHNCYPQGVTIKIPVFEPTAWCDWCQKSDHTNAECSSVTRPEGWSAPQGPATTVSDVQTTPIKDHEIREFVNSLTKVAKSYSGTQQLRARIAEEVHTFVSQQQGTGEAFETKSNPTTEDYEKAKSKIKDHLEATPAEYQFRSINNPDIGWIKSSKAYNEALNPKVYQTRVLWEYPPKNNTEEVSPKSLQQATAKLLPPKKVLPTDNTLTEWHTSRAHNDCISIMEKNIKAFYGSGNE